MSISDLIVVMREGVVQQVGKPQEVYDSPANLFVAKFLGTPPINVFNGEVRDGKLYIGDEAILDTSLDNCEVDVAIRPEGFELSDNGVLTCELSRVEVMGRDVSIVATHSSAHTPTLRAIIDSDNVISTDRVRFDIKPSKLFVFDKSGNKLTL